jgi:hypothetical protein
MSSQIGGNIGDLTEDQEVKVEFVSTRTNSSDAACMVVLAHGQTHAMLRHHQMMSVVCDVLEFQNGGPYSLSDLDR